MTDRQTLKLLIGAIIVGWLLSLLSPILTPFICAALLAYLFDPLVDRLEHYRCNRFVAVCAVFAFMVGLFFIFILFLVPLLESQLKILGPYLLKALEFGNDFLATHFGGVATESIFSIKELKAQALNHIDSISDVFSYIASLLQSSGTTLAIWIGNIFLIPVITFYLLKDWDTILLHIRALLPQRIEGDVVRLAKESDDVLGAFLRGQLLVMLALAVVYSLGLWLVGLDLAFLIGFVAGIVNFVPYLGVIIGVLFGTIAAAVELGGGLPIVWVILVFAFGQILEGAVLSPLLVGERIGLHPVAVIFAVLMGGQLFGFFGVLLALPAAAVVMVGLRNAHKHYVNSELYTQAKMSNKS